MWASYVPSLSVSTRRTVPSTLASAAACTLSLVSPVSAVSPAPRLAPDCCWVVVPVDELLSAAVATAVPPTAAPAMTAATGTRLRDSLGMRVGLSGGVSCMTAISSPRLRETWRLAERLLRSLPSHPRRRRAHRGPHPGNDAAARARPAWSNWRASTPRAVEIPYGH